MNLFKLLLGVAVLSLIAALVMVFTGNTANAGPLFIFFFIALAISFRGFSMLKGFSYTVIIFAAVTTALYYPKAFIQMNGFVFATLITPFYR